MSPSAARAGARAEFVALDELEDLLTRSAGQSLGGVLPVRPPRCACPHPSLSVSCALSQGHAGSHRTPVVADRPAGVWGPYLVQECWDAPPTEWHLAGLRVAGAPDPHLVRDLTCGRWHKMCDVRWHPEGSMRGYTCTRRSGHTGRHAAGSRARVIVAVWGVKHAPGAVGHGAVEQSEGDVVLEVTA